MSKIVKLDEKLANQISAWEVVERPLSVVKELVENSIDSGANYIKVEIKDWWIKEIIVSDNWTWIEKEYLALAIEKHSTSKIKNLNDLYNVLTFWFRWEALSSISSVSKFEIFSKIQDNPTWYGFFNWKIVEAVIDNWTKVVVKDLFYNTPARLNYLKKERTEYTHIYNFLNQICLSYADIGFEFVSDWRQVFKYKIGESLETRIYSIYDEEFFNNLIKIDFETIWIKISWYISDSKISFPNKTRQSLFVNHRVITSYMISKAIQDTYNRYIPHSSFPAYVLFLDIDPTLVDVNVHPRKQELKFANEQEIFRAFYNCVDSKLTNIFLLDIASDVNNLWEKHPLNNNFSVDKNRFWDTTLKKENYYTWSWTKFKSYSPYKNIKTNPNQSSIWQAIDFTKHFLWEQKNQSEDNDLAFNINSWDLHDTKLWKIIWQTFNSYIIVENKSELLILDQHALAERIIYEKLVSKSYKANVQKLLIPESFNLTKIELDILLDNIEYFKNIWFDIDQMSSSIIVLNWIPDFIRKKDIKEVFLWILSDLSNSFKSKTLEEVKNTIYAYTACRSAIKFWNKLNLFELNKLINDSVLSYSSTCPHGRPVVFNISLGDLKNKFER